MTSFKTKQGMVQQPSRFVKIITQFAKKNRPQIKEAVSPSTLSPRVVVYTTDGTRIPKALLKAGINIIALAEQRDVLHKASKIKVALHYLYWHFVKWSCPAYNSFLARRNKLAYTTTTGPNSNAFRAWLSNLKPDILLIYKTSLLEEATFSIPKYGTINIHPSLLPKYRGGHPIFWKYYHYDLDSGCTIHYVDHGIDTGPIIDQSSFTISPGMTEKEVETLAIEQHAIPMLINIIKSHRYLGWRTTPLRDIKQYPYARRLSLKEYYEHLNWAEWSLHHMWHVLRCCEHWKHKFDTESGLNRFYDWSIGRYEETYHLYTPGQFVQTLNRAYITHKDGIIHIKRRLSLKKMFRYLIQSWYGRSHAV